MNDEIHGKRRKKRTHQWKSNIFLFVYSSFGYAQTKINKKKNTVVDNHFVRFTYFIYRFIFSIQSIHNSHSIYNRARWWDVQLPYDYENGMSNFAVFVIYVVSANVFFLLSFLSTQSDLWPTKIFLIWYQQNHIWANERTKYRKTWMSMNWCHCVFVLRMRKKTLFA